MHEHKIPVSVSEFQLVSPKRHTVIAGKSFKTWCYEYMIVNLLFVFVLNLYSSAFVVVWNGKFTDCSRLSSHS